MVIFQKRISGLSEASLNRFVLRARKAARLRGYVNVLVTSSAAMRDLNLRFRGQNKPTDVLSFPSERHQKQTRAREKFAGELAISAEIAAQNSVQLGHSIASEVRVLVLHGILHLAGFDHERDNGQMARKEAALRRILRLPATLTERAQSAQERCSRPTRLRRTT